MPEGLRSQSSPAIESSSEARPTIAACRSCPGKLVFIESGNTDGWLSTDVTVDLSP